MQAVFDGHNDALTKEDYRDFASGRTGGHLDLPRMHEAGIRGAIFAIFSPSPPQPEQRLPRPGPRPQPPLTHPGAAAHATVAAGRLLGLERAGALRLARGIADVDRAGADSGPPVGVLHLEGAEAIDPELEALELWYAAGLRSIGPVWSRSNAFAHGVPLITPGTPDIGPGLTKAGFGLVGRCAELGIAIDLSHLNEAGFWDIARMDVGPLIASHSGVHALCGSPRNLTDAQLDQIGASGGLVGIVFGSRFLRADFANDPDTKQTLIVEHARYVADRIGVEHVALGSDFDGTTIPDELGDAAGVPVLLEEFARAGFTDAEIAAIAWDNWRRVLAAWWSD